MKALCLHGKGDVRVDTVPDPMIQDPLTQSSRLLVAEFAVQIFICSTATCPR